jgi:hypothetical protein
MPDYYFENRRRFGFDEDQFGVALSDINSAREHALKFGQTVSRNFQKHQAGLPSRAEPEICVEVVEETSGLTILRVPFEGAQRQAPQQAAA